MRCAEPFSAQQAADTGFWKTLSPEMAIEGDHPAQHWDLPPTVSPMSLLKHEGYVNQPGIIPSHLTNRMHDCVHRLTVAGIPAVFSFVYDEFWLIPGNLSTLFKKILGDDYRVIPSIWTWYVPPADDGAGWPPHRDRLDTRCLRDDGTPNCVTLWLPLTDADPLNGCVYVLPAHQDEHFAKRDWSEKETNDFVLRGTQLQNIRALIAPAGSVLLWNHLLLHWGARASSMASHPRCSIALELQRGDIRPFEVPLLDPEKPPTFKDRLGLIADQIIKYAKFKSFRDPQTLLIATFLKMKYYPK